MSDIFGETHWEVGSVFLFLNYSSQIHTQTTFHTFLSSSPIRHFSCLSVSYEDMSANVPFLNKVSG